MKNWAFAYDSTYAYNENRLLLIDPMIMQCPKCTAFKYEKEPKGMCCQDGKVRVPDLLPPPQVLQELLDGTSPHSTAFLRDIRAYNNAFQMTSFGCTKRVQEAGHMPTFKVQGQVYHLLGSILPPMGPNNEPVAPSFLQVFFMGDSNVQSDYRNKKYTLTKPFILRILQNMLNEHNPYIALIKTATELMPTDDYRLVIHADKAPRGMHPETFNAPTLNEVAIIMDNEQAEHRDIILYKRNNDLQRINEFHQSYDALQYPLAFWNGQAGYHFHIPQIINGQPSDRKTVSCMDFYASMLMIRSKDPGITNWLNAYGGLTHHMLVVLHKFLFYG